MAGMAADFAPIPGSLVTSLKQINNLYKDKDKKYMANFCLYYVFNQCSMGIDTFDHGSKPGHLSVTGFILIGISCVCFSIFSKLFLVSIS